MPPATDSSPPKKSSLLQPKRAPSGGDAKPALTDDLIRTSGVKRMLLANLLIYTGLALILVAAVLLALDE